MDDDYKKRFKELQLQLRKFIDEQVREIELLESIPGQQTLFAARIRRQVVQELGSIPEFVGNAEIESDDSADSADSCPPAA
ncbi:hypothetical protein [uncultured Corynebacterium sp.]|uniref:hypothetical protein n=1 Tax=uncultured Corynebacterium sp. TaxID=159447 RepID=UPI0025942BC7|nr:hypothetical protein [uncultured Corynebacterium sp.]